MYIAKLQETLNDKMFCLHCVAIGRQRAFASLLGVVSSCMDLSSLLEVLGR